MDRSRHSASNGVTCVVINEVNGGFAEGMVFGVGKLSKYASGMVELEQMILMFPTRNPSVKSTVMCGWLLWVNAFQVFPIRLVGSLEASGENNSNG